MGGGSFGNRPKIFSLFQISQARPIMVDTNSTAS